MQRDQPGVVRPSANGREARVGGQLRQRRVRRAEVERDAVEQGAVFVEMRFEQLRPGLASPPWREWSSQILGRINRAVEVELGEIVVRGRGEQEHGFGRAGDVELAAFGCHRPPIHPRQQPRGEFHVRAAGAGAAGIVLVAAVLLLHVHDLAVEVQSSAGGRLHGGVARAREAHLESERARLVRRDPHHQHIVRRGHEGLARDRGVAAAEARRAPGRRPVGAPAGKPCAFPSPPKSSHRSPSGS